MAYSTQSELLQRIPSETLLQLTDDLDNGVIDRTKVEAAIARADQEIDARCAALYRVPLAPLPPIIVGLSADLAIYYLYGRTVDEIPEARKDSFKNAIKLLGLIAGGQVELGAAKIASASPSSAAVVSGNGRLFRRDQLRGM